MDTVLLRVQNYVLQAVDSHGGAVLVLFDLSAAIDNIDHEKLKRTLDTYCGIKQNPLKCFLSYLKGRVQSVQIGSTFSLAREREREQNLLFGVPQGSVLGPELFTIYTTPLGRIIQGHGLSCHLYADDTQLYMAFKPSGVTSKYYAISRLKTFVTDMDEWQFLEVKWWQNWTSDHYNKRIAQQNIRYINQGRWPVDLSKWWSTKKIRCDIRFYMLSWFTHC